MASTTVPQEISLLWPPERGSSSAAAGLRLDPGTVASLDLHSTVDALCLERRYSSDISTILFNLCQDPAVIQYRQEVIDDLLSSPALERGLDDLLPKIATLEHYSYSGRPGQTPLHEVVWRAGQLEAYIECVTGLGAIFETVQHELRSAGLRHLRDVIAQIQADPTFARLVEELPELLENIRSIASITIGVNLDNELRPVEATLLAINRKKFHGPTFSLFQLLRGRDDKHDDWEGIAQLHSIPQQAASKQAENRYGYDLNNPLMYPLFRDLSQVLKQVSRPVAAALQRYVQVNTRFLGALRVELAFYLGAAHLIKRLQAAGLPMCRPALADAEARRFEVEGIYNLNLALRMLGRGDTLDRDMIANDVLFGPEGRIFVLTGPNQGGKTTYTQAIGLVQVLAQAGLYVPGAHACLSPVDNLYTHFPVEEQPELETGRLGEEAKRLSEIFSRATRHSLVLLNESLSSTSSGESLYLARDIVAILRRLGARAVFATHLHELAAEVDELNAETPGDSKVISLVSLVSHEGVSGSSEESIQRTYKIVPGPPMGQSYAREIASRYGISYEQLIHKLRERGVLDGDGT